VKIPFVCHDNTTTCKNQTNSEIDLLKHLKKELRAFWKKEEEERLKKLQRVKQLSILSMITKPKGGKVEYVKQ
jgi:hypothetical protein